MELFDALRGAKGTSRLCAMAGRRSRWTRGGRPSGPKTSRRRWDRFPEAAENWWGVVLTGFDDDHADPDGLGLAAGGLRTGLADVSQVLQGHGERQAPVSNVIRKHERTAGEYAEPARARVGPASTGSTRAYLGRRPVGRIRPGALLAARPRDMDSSNKLQHRAEDRGDRSGRFRVTSWTGDTEKPAVGTGLWRSSTMRYWPTCWPRPHHGSKNAAQPWHGP